MIHTLHHRVTERATKIFLKSENGSISIEITKKELSTFFLSESHSQSCWILQIVKKKVNYPKIIFRACHRVKRLDLISNSADGESLKNNFEGSAGNQFNCIKRISQENLNFLRDLTSLFSS